MQLTKAYKRPKHGADLTSALQQYGGAAAQWLDLSAAISPYSWYSERALPASVDSVRELPQLNTALQQACEFYYGRQGLAVAGSQAVIQALPYCLAPSRVWILKGCYGEHAYAWQKAALHTGHHIEELTLADIRTRFSNNQIPNVLVLVNPNNPSGELLTSREVHQLAQALNQQQGLLVLDETFMDCYANDSYLIYPANDAVLILRSLGKFFGLAGLRIGFAFGSNDLLARLENELGPWAVNGMALEYAANALKDEAWQLQQRVRLQRMQEQVVDACERFHLPVQGSTPLFITLAGEQVLHWQQQLAQQQIWTRVFAEQNLLRIAMPSAEQWPRLYAGLKSLQQ